MSLSSAKAKLDAQGGDPVTGYISKTDHQESYDELLDDTALTGATTAEALDVTGALTAGTVASDATVAGTGLAGDLLSAATPVMDGVAAAGTSAIPSRDDHVHASDATKVTGPASSTDNALVRFDGATGKLAQNSGITVDDSGNVTSDLFLSKTSPQVIFVNTGTGGKEMSLGSGASGGALIYDNLGYFYIMSNTSAAIAAGTGLSGATARVTVTDTGKTTLGSVGATAGLELGSSGPRVMSGTGSPEGVVTAPINSVWNRSDGDTLGDFVYRKQSGTGNTGWVVSEGDTGLRNLAAESLSNSWAVSSSSFAVRRVGTLVFLTIAASKAAASPTDSVVYTLPSGFRPDAYVYPVFNVSGADDYGAGYVATSGAILIYGSTMTGSVARLTVSYFTNNAWPSSLPGTA